MIFDQTGNLANVKRHDYLPFGEELFGGTNANPGTGGRKPSQGYGCDPSDQNCVTDKVTQKFTLKERDVETGLDFFGARYYGSIQGRFTGVDSAGPDLATPQTLNRYQYCLNNPLAKVDRNGRYEEDVHRDLTYALALAAGFNATSAKSIADANQGVDDNPATSPMGMTFWGKDVEIREQYHFTTDSRRNEMWNNFETSQSLQDLGAFFHAQQDSFSHEGYGARFGHLKDGHWPDKTFNRPGRADVMALDTLNRMKSALSRLVIYGKETVHYDAVQWKTIRPMVEAFNRARTDKEKKKIVNDLVNAVQGEHRRQEPERIRNLNIEAAIKLRLGLKVRSN
jgi:RHS repeat-associated protein